MRHAFSKQETIVIDPEIISALQKSIEKYNSVDVELEPTSEDQLLALFTNNTDPVYARVRDAFGHSFEVLDNEIRAMLGHCISIDGSNSKDRNLEKAYGHFRRMNIDMFKILCDEFDNFFNHWNENHCKYNFNEIREQFLKTINEKYYNAKRKYIKTQCDESVGSDYGNLIIGKYRDAASAYIDMFAFYLIYREKIERKKQLSDFGRWICWFVSVFSIIGALISFL